MSLEEKSPEDSTYHLRKRRVKVEEVFETLNEFLDLASKKYEVQRYVDVKQISDKDLYGPLGCEFWGKDRAEGSNACVEKAKSGK